MNKARFSRIVVIAAAVLTQGVATMHATAQTPPFLNDSAMRAIVRDRVVSGHRAGIVIGLTENGKHRVFAFGDQIPGQMEIDANSIFEIGSITKVFTATTLADLVLSGEVNLDDPVAKFLPATTKVPERNGKQITLFDLATQSSGLPRLPSNLHPSNVANPYADYTVQNLYDFLSSYTLTRDIGSQYEYSNLGVGLLGLALANRENTSYEQLVHKHVLDPLKMHNTGITLTPDMQKHLAIGHLADGSPAHNWDLPTFAGAGALRSNVNDMLIFLDANVAENGPLGKAMALAHEPKRPAGAMLIGLNWHILGTGDNAIVWHNGGTGGYTSFIGFNIATGRGVVILTSSGRGSDDIGMHLLNPAIPLGQ